MTNVLNYETVVKKLIDDLKAIFNNYGLGGGGFEYKIMSEVFTYKLLNDKFIREMKNLCGYSENIHGSTSDFFSEISDEDYEGYLQFVSDSTAKMKKEHLLFNIYNKSEGNIHAIFDKALLEVSALNKKIFNIHTSDNEDHELFDSISQYVKRDSDGKNKFTKAIIERLCQESFEPIFEENFDFFSHIFEYLIKSYNTDSGRYSEFYTPKFAGDIISRIMIKDDEKVSNVKIYDPSSGSGMLLMTLANRINMDNCSLYSQDISQKSSDFLRLNLILNGMTKSLDNVIQGDTLADPYHKENDNELMKFDYIVANPPFKNDFSSSVNILESDVYTYKENGSKDLVKRFFAGVPDIPPKKKDGMPIYLMFIQHILASLKDNGKACIVVPSGFCTDSSKIALKIRETFVDKNYLEGVIQMPSNIFSNTGTNVSIICINKAKENNDVILIDASGLGKKVKKESGQKTELSSEDENQIVNTYHNKTDLDNFSKKVTIDEIKENSYQINPGRYFDVKFEELLSGKDLDNKIDELVSSLQESFIKSNELQLNVLKQLGGVISE